MQKRSLIVALMLGALPAMLVTTSRAKAKDDEHEPVECVRLAPTWDEAVEEAQLRNVPIVVHSHGFYCGPCWGMHKAVMCNSKYIDFASEGTVEVIVLGRLDEARKKKERRAATYEGIRNGKPAEFLCEFPGLTFEEMIALQRSKAGTYNDTGKIPFTCLVDPYTLEEIQRWEGSTSASTIMDAATEARSKLVEEHGESIDGKDWSKLLEVSDEAWEEVADGDYGKALKKIDKLAAKTEDWPEKAKERLGRVRGQVVAAAETALTDMEARLEAEGVKAKGDLRDLIRKLKGTGLEARAKDLLARS